MSTKQSLENIAPVGTEKERGTLEGLRNKARSKPQLCYNPVCKEKTIRSHIHQKNGALLNIAPNSFVIQLERNSLKENLGYHFEKKGIYDPKNDVLTFWGFCNKCDNEIFRPIEPNSREIKVDFKNYRNQLLFSYRGLLNELYKQDYNLNWYDLIFADKNLSQEQKDTWKPVRFVQGYSRSGLLFAKSLFEQDLSNESSSNFEFIHFSLPKVGICASLLFGGPCLVRIPPQEIERIIKERVLLETGENLQFLNIIPTDTSTEVILGQINNPLLANSIDLKRILAKNIKDRIKLISDIIIKYGETWAISIELYNTYISRKLDKEILNQIHKHFYNKNKHTNFNMFQDIIKIK